MEPRFSLWAYPWDINAIGIHEALEEMKATGFNTLSLTLSYHAGRFVEPRNPRSKVYFPQDGTIYFQPRQHYERIQPEVATLVRENDVSRAIIAQAIEAGLQVASWTVCLHNTRIGMAYSDVATENAFGDKNFYNLCPSQPDVQRYITTLVADIGEIPGITSIELESLNYMGFDHRFHHEKDGVGLTKLDKFLLSVCFCSYCMAGAQHNNIDAQEARRNVAERLTEHLQREFPDQQEGQAFAEQGLSFFVQQQELHRYLRWRKEPVTRLLESTKAAIPTGVNLFFLDILGSAPAWMYGIDFAELARACDGIVTCCYGMDPTEVAHHLEEARQAIGTLNLYAGFRLFYPEMQGASALRERITAAKQAGANGIALYNYGLVPQTRMQWAKTALSSW